MSCHAREGNAWDAVVYGRKRWFLFAAFAFAGPPHAPMDDWIAEILPALPTRPLECVQEAGEVLYVPQGMVRCVVNVLPTASVEGEVGPDLASPEEGDA